MVSLSSSCLRPRAAAVGADAAVGTCGNGDDASDGRGSGNGVGVAGISQTVSLSAGSNHCHNNNVPESDAEYYNEADCRAFYLNPSRFLSTSLEDFREVEAEKGKHDVLLLEQLVHPRLAEAAEKRDEDGREDKKEPESHTVISAQTIAPSMKCVNSKRLQASGRRRFYGRSSTASAVADLLGPIPEHAPLTSSSSFPELRFPSDWRQDAAENSPRSGGGRGGLSRRRREQLEEQEGEEEEPVTHRSPVSFETGYRQVFAVPQQQQQQQQQQQREKERVEQIGRIGLCQRVISFNDVGHVAAASERGSSSLSFELRQERVTENVQCCDKETTVPFLPESGSKRRTKSAWSETFQSGIHFVKYVVVAFMMCLCMLSIAISLLLLVHHGNLRSSPPSIAESDELSETTAIPPPAVVIPPPPEVIAAEPISPQPTSEPLVTENVGKAAESSQASSSSTSEAIVLKEEEEVGGQEGANSPDYAYADADADASSQQRYIVKATRKDLALENEIAAAAVAAAEAEAAAVAAAEAAAAAAEAAEKAAAAAASTIDAEGTRVEKVVQASEGEDDFAAAAAAAETAAAAAPSSGDVLPEQKNAGETEHSEPSAEEEVELQQQRPEESTTTTTATTTTADPTTTTTASTEEANKTEADIPSFREWTQKALEEEQKKKEEDKRKKEEDKRKQQQLLQQQQQQQLQQQQQQLQQQQQQQTNPSDESNSTSNAAGHDAASSGVGAGVSGGGANGAHGHNGNGLNGRPEDLAAASAPTTKTTTTTKKTLKKNFASLDCGAKVVGANAEGRGSGNIISPSKDEYMLNKCTDRAWFVVELCESIKALKMELANFELYSSVPREFRVYMSNSYPVRDKDWTLFGQFEAADERVEQSFHPASGGVFGRYAKVEILSHHGNEHYCPVSLFRMYGTSEIEILGEEDDEDDDDDVVVSNIVDLDNSVTEETLENANNLPSPATTTTTEAPAPEPSNGIVSYIKEKVDQTIEKVVGAFRRKPTSQGDDDMAPDTLSGNSFRYNVSCPDCDRARFYDVVYLLANDYGTLARTLDNPLIADPLSNGLCQELGFSLPAEKPQVCLFSCAMEFHRTLFGTTRSIALCNVLTLKQGGLPLAVEQQHRRAGLGGENAESSYLPSGSARPGNNSAAVIGGDNEAANGTAVTGNGAGSTDANDGKRAATGDASPQPMHTAQAGSGQATATEQNGRPASAPVASANGDQVANGGSASETASTPEMKDLPPVVHVTPSSTEHISSTTTGSTGTIEAKANGGSQGQRDSVWQKLSNKIKTLERNVTLSSGYLEELSVRYKKQIEDLQLSVRQGAEALAVTAKDREMDQRQIQELRTQLETLLERVDTVETYLNTMSTWMFSIHGLFIIVEVCVGFIFLYSCSSCRWPERIRSSISNNVWRNVSEESPADAGIVLANGTVHDLAGQDDDDERIVYHSGHHQQQQQQPFEPNDHVPASSTPLKRRFLSPRPPLKSSSPQQGKPFLGHARRHSVEAQNTMAEAPPAAVVATAVRRKSFDSNKALSPGADAGVALSRNQRKRLAKRMNKVASTGHLQDLDTELHSSNLYHTVSHPGGKSGKMTHSLPTSPHLPSSRFHVSPVSGSAAGSAAATAASTTAAAAAAAPASDLTPNGAGVRTANKFGVLNSSLHDDPLTGKDFCGLNGGTPKRLLHNGMNGHANHLSVEEEEEDDDDFDDEGGNWMAARARPRPRPQKTKPTQDEIGNGATTPGGSSKKKAHHRSKSTSPPRLVGQTAKQKDLFKNFNPDKAEWIPKQQQE